MMKNHLFAALFVCLSFILISFSNPGNNLPVSNVKDSTLVASSSEPENVLSTTLYQSLHLDETGLSKDALDYAVMGYEKLLSQGAVNNSQYLTVVDFSQSSRQKRFYLLDVKNQKLVLNTFVAHGKNSGIDKAERFSNDLNSEESSLGFYVTKTPYSGKHGLSLRIAGMEEGFNDNAEARGVVVHGASYVNQNRVHSDYMGRSQGCPALPQNEYAKVINLIKDGSVLFIYSPSSDYLQQSDFLNS